VKRKGAPTDPEAERELLRQLTRELHEAAQDARDAARVLRAERAEAAALIGDQAVGLVNPIIEEMNRHIKDAEGNLVSQMIEIEKLVTDKFAVFTGMADFAEMQTFLAKSITDELNRREYVETITSGLLRRMKASRQGGGAEIKVATAAQLEAYILAGGDPGVVLDLRDQP
jgi:hypothetical protein